MFSSYACVDGNLLGGHPFKKFTTMLRDLVANKVTDARTQLSFVDQTGIKVGDEWEEVLVDGVRRSEVLVCFVSPRYLGSSWCGRELEVFVQRLKKWKAQAVQGGHPGRFVFIVWWEKPKDRTTLPPKLRVFNPADAGFPASYFTKGLRQLASLNAGEDDVREIADTLSDRIVETLDSAGKLPVGEAIPDFNNFPSAFDEVSPVLAYQIAAFATMPGGIAWTPPGTTTNLAQIVDRVASKLNSTGRPLDVTKGVSAALQEARANRQLLLVVVDAGDGPRDPALLEINNCNLPNLALLILHSSAGSTNSPTPEAWASQFPEGSFLEALRGGAQAWSARAMWK